MNIQLQGISSGQKLRCSRLGGKAFPGESRTDGDSVRDTMRGEGDLMGDFTQFREASKGTPLRKGWYVMPIDLWSLLKHPYNWSWHSCTQGAPVEQLHHAQNTEAAVIQGKNCIQGEMTTTEAEHW
jgi:hypothetical protein